MNAKSINIFTFELFPSKMWMRNKNNKILLKIFTCPSFESNQFSFIENEKNLVNCYFV